MLLMLYIKKNNQTNKQKQKTNKQQQQQQNKNKTKQTKKTPVFAVSEYSVFNTSWQFCILPKITGLFY